MADQKKRNLLIIGAGASLGARTPRPPDGRQLLGELNQILVRLSSAQSKDSINYYETLAQMYGDGSFFSRAEVAEATDFIQSAICTGKGYEAAISEAMGENTVEGKRLLLILNRLIAFSFCFGPGKLGPQLPSFRPSQDLYDKCIDHLKIDASWGVVSLNYDMLFEQALFRRGIPYCFAEMNAGLVGDKSGVALYKIHGSINWFPVPAQTLHVENPSEEEKRRATLSLTWDNSNKRFSNDFPDVFVADYPLIYQQLIRDNELERCPVMAHYGPRKPVDINFAVIDRVRKASLVCSSGADRAFIIGVRPVTESDDPILHRIFENLKGKDVTYVNPSELEAEALAKHLGYKREVKTFECWLK